MSFIRFSGALLLVAFAAGATAHPGGLNAKGCHNDRKNGGYHCHRAQAAPASPTQQAAADQPAQPAKRAAPEPQPTGPKCYVGPRGGTYTITPSGRKNYSGC